MNIKIILLFLITSHLAHSQSHSYEIKFSHEIEKGISDQSLRSSKAGLLYSLIGKYHLSNTYSDFPVSWGVDTLALDKYEIVDALSPILEEAKNHQLVIISENHLKPQHRIFAKRLIRGLSEMGYRHLGLETFAHAGNNELIDSKLKERGYPLDSPLTGTYTMESEMGELVREAIDLNYKLFAYERTEKIKGMDRDEIQANNIINYLRNHPNGKMVILCGFHHAIESDLKKYGKYKWLAKHLKDETGIDPLTIYQDNFTEKFAENEHPILSQIIIKTPSVFRDQTGNIVKLSDQVDMEVIHPKTVYKDGRPHWLFENDDHRQVNVKTDFDSLSYPIIASAFRKNEINAVPVDRIEIKHRYDKKSLVLKSGEYIIEVSDGKFEKSYGLVLDKKD